MKIRIVSMSVVALIAAHAIGASDAAQAAWFQECWPQSSEYVPPECNQWDNSGENPECVNWTEGYVRINEGGCRMVWYDDGHIPPTEPGTLACLDGCRFIRQDSLAAAVQEKASCERAVEQEAARRCSRWQPAEGDNSEESHAAYGLCMTYYLWSIDGSIPVPPNLELNAGTPGLMRTCSEDYDNNTVQAWRDEDSCRDDCLS